VKFNVKYPGQEILVYEIMLGDRSCLPHRVPGENSLELYKWGAESRRKRKKKVLDFSEGSLNLNGA